VLAECEDGPLRLVQVRMPHGGLADVWPGDLFVRRDDAERECALRALAGAAPLETLYDLEPALTLAEVAAGIRPRT
jgi:hypothetical protein